MSTPVGASIAWTGSAAILRQLIQFAGLIALSALLTPSDFGLAALMMAVTAFVSLVLEAGLVPAVVSKAGPSDSFLSSALTINIVIAAVLCLGIVVGSPLLANLYDQPMLVPMLLVGAAATTLLSVYFVPLALLMRSMRFRDIAVIETLSTTVGQLGAVIYALQFRSAISLALAPAVTMLCMTVAFWLSSHWIPRARPNRDNFAEVWNYCKHLLLFNSVNYFSRNADTLLLGRSVSTTELGLYSRAYLLMSLPIQQVSNVIARVYLPVLSRLQDHPEMLLQQWVKAAAKCWLVGMPIAVLVVVLGDDLTVLIFGPEWEKSGELLQIFGLAIAPQLITRTTGAVYQSLGQTRRQSTTGFINCALILIGVVAGLQYGTFGVAVFSALALWSHLVVIVIDLKMWTPLRIRMLLAELMVPAGSSGLQAGILLALQRVWLQEGGFVKVMLLAGLSAATYIIAISAGRFIVSRFAVHKKGST